MVVGFMGAVSVVPGDGKHHYRAIEAAPEEGQTQTVSPLMA